MYSLKEEKISQITPFSVLADNKRIRNKILDGKSTQATRSGYNLVKNGNKFKGACSCATGITGSLTNEGYQQFDVETGNGHWTTRWFYSINQEIEENLSEGDTFTIMFTMRRTEGISNPPKIYIKNGMGYYSMIGTLSTEFSVVYYTGTWKDTNGISPHLGFGGLTGTFIIKNWMIKKGGLEEWEDYGASPSPEFPSEIKSVGDDVNLAPKINNTNYVSIYPNSTIYADNEVSFDLSAGTGAGISSIPINVKDLKTISLSAYLKSSDSNTKIALRIYKQDGTTVLSYGYQGTITTDYKRYIINDIDVSNEEVVIIKLLRITDTGIASMKNIKLQKGTVATPYSEYGKGTVTIEQRGKNLFNYEYAKKYSNTIVSSYRFVKIADIEQGKQYTLGNLDISEIENETGLYIYITNYPDYNNGIIKGNSLCSNSNKLSNKVKILNVPTLSNSLYIGVFPNNITEEQWNKILSKFSNAVLEEGLYTEETMPSYTPYQHNNYVIPLSAPLRSLPNGTKDTIEEDGIHRRVGSRILDGSENWGTIGDNRYWVAFPLKRGLTSPVPCNLMSNYFKSTQNAGDIVPVGYMTEGYYSKANYNVFFNYNGNNNDLDGFKKWLSENPTTVQYELAEEVVEPFTEEQLEVLNSMETLEGTNHFSLIGDLQTTLTFDYNPKVTEEIKRAFKYNITKAYLEVAATDKDSGFQINEDNYLQSIDFDDCRYIEGEGIIGSCVAKELQGKFVNVDTSFDIENRELDCFIGAETEDNITHYLRLGTFIVQKPENDNVKDNTSFDSLDYMIKFNKEYVHRMAKYLKTKDIDIIKDKQYYILTESGAYEEVIVPHKEEISNYYELIDEYTLMQLLKDICEQCEVKLGTFNFRNADYVVHGNRFDTGTTCRDVLKAIAQAAFSWARINEYNELLLDFETSDTISEEIDYNEYYNLSFNDKYGPVNTIVLKNSQVEGENITVQDETLVKKYGIKELAISDNPFAYSEETRKAIIEAGKMLYGFTYVPLTVETIGAAYLNCKDKIKVKNMQDGDLETYLFDTRISYQGTLKSNVETLAMTDTETKYRYDGSLTTAQRRTEFRVDKAEQKITSLVKATTEQREKLTEATQDLDGFKRTIIDKTDETAEKVTAIEETVNGLVTEKSVSGGQNLIKNSVGYFGNDYWQINETTEGKVLNDNSTDVKQNSISGSALKLQAETIYQDIKEIKNGEYYLSFNYKRIINTAIATLKVNDLIINLTEENWKEEAHLINVTTNNIRIEITTDLNSSILITDLMLTEGNIKVSWTQNANESYTDTVQIGKGVRITATGSDTEFVAEATGITINNTETGGKVAEFTKYGTETQELVAHKDVKVADSLLIQKIGNQTWFSSL